MKTLKITLLIAIITLLTTAVFATGNLKVNILQEEVNTAVIEATNLKAELFEIEVKNDRGEKIFNEITKSNTDYRWKYDFSYLEDGIYHLNVKHGNEYYKKRFRLETGDVTILEERKVVEPFFKQDGSNVKMSYLNFSKDFLSIYVYDGNILLHEQDFNNEFAINKIIDMSDLQSGNYQIVLASGLEVFEHNVTVD